MTTNPTLTHTQSEENVIHQLLTRPLPDTADPIVLSEACAAWVSVLVETGDRETHAALCERLLHGLNQLRAHCDNALPSYLVEQVVAGEKLNACVPECWQDASLQVDYAKALTHAIAGKTLPTDVAKELTKLLHDMVWLLADFVKESDMTAR
ncbi:TPA: hypothetical protein QCJ76_003541 [Enterobacter asburiae]|nr:hypothetical protein [Enterobacter asburiae]